ncbi:outer membrane protein [Roseovarius sp. EL26]|uniref:outer membrane protein n=1 Tax=Roseovarius sp. EL26 TaxID=2126672 RepID=UPI0013C3EB63|nr:outer membrane beta-barrel protein [Roseovarius sp. EL26]
MKNRFKNFCNVTATAAVLGTVLVISTEQSAAGNLEEPVVIAPVAVATPTVLDLSGFYVGGSLAYGVGISDDVGHKRPNGVLVTTPGTVNPAGINYGVRLGWRNNLPLGRLAYVHGFELGYDLADIEDSFSTATYNASSEIESVLSLKYKGGLTNLSKNTLFYSTIGYTRSEIDYSVVGATGSDAINLNSSTDKDGLVFGLGVERAINQDLSVLFEWEYNYIDGFSLSDGAGASTVVTPSFNNFRLGLNYNF